MLQVLLLGDRGMDLQLILEYLRLYQSLQGRERERGKCVLSTMAVYTNAASYHPAIKHTLFLPGWNIGVSPEAAVREGWQLGGVNVT